MQVSRLSAWFRAIPCLRHPRMLGRVVLMIGFVMMLCPVQAQLLFNVDFGAGRSSAKVGWAATGLSTNDFWNLYAPYGERHAAGMAPVPDGRLTGARLADGSPTGLELTVTNGPGVWGNATGDPMLDTYVFAPNGSNLVVTLSGLDAGPYHFFLYGHAAADVVAEQNSVFTLHCGTNRYGPASATLPSGWQAGQPWQDRAQFVVFRDVAVAAGEPVRLEVAGGPNGVPVLNGMQVLSRGTGPPRPVAAPLPADPGILTNLMVRSVHYSGRMSEAEARFAVTVDAESLTTNELAEVLFEGPVALLDPQLPEGWRLVNRGPQVLLVAGRPAAARLSFTLLARIERKEPWNQVDFVGPAAAMATVEAAATEADVQVELLSGTPVDAAPRDAGTVRGALGADRRLSLRWQSRTAEVTRAAVVTVETASSMAIDPVAVRHTTRFAGEVLQGGLSRLRVALPPGQNLTRLEAGQVRDWQVIPEAGRSILVLEFLKPVEGEFNLTLVTEQALGVLPLEVELAPPQPLDLQRESGSLTVAAEDVDVRFQNVGGLRQINAAVGTVAAYRFHGRPAGLRAELRRIQPEIQVTSRVTAWAGETMMSARYLLSLEVARAGVYSLDATLPPGLRLAEVHGQGIEDWTTSAGRVEVRFGQRVLGSRQLDLRLEQGYPEVPSEWVLEPVRISAATRESATIGVGSAAGILLKTLDMDGLRELPTSALSERSEETLAFGAEQGAWRLRLAAERLEARVVAEVFNLFTIGDGLVGGSATLRYGILNQGVQQFRVRVPAHWRNLEFTGPNIRGKDHRDDVWTIALQDKVWGGYTLVVTYDTQFDPQRASLDLAGARPLEVLRESGTVAITTAAGLEVEPAPIAAPLRRIDVSEIPEADRSLIARPVLYAYRYDVGGYQLKVDLARHEEVQPLDAVADRTQITTVLTEAGEMLTQAGFMVKNNDRQFQRFQLPPDATLWGVYVNGQPAKAERDADWLLVSLPRVSNRDQAFAVDLKYAQQLGAPRRWFPQRFELVAPRTDVPSTYAEWELFVPTGRQLTKFGGNMTAARGTVHGFRDAWDAFTGFYRGLWIEHGARLVIWGGVLLLIGSLVVGAMRRGVHAVVQVLVIFTVFAILAGMLLPALSKAKAKAQRISSVNNLKQIGLAARIFAADNSDRLPSGFEEMMQELGTDRVLIDPETGERYTYVGAGKSEADPFAILAYSSSKQGRREVALVDGSVQVMTEPQFQEALAKEAVSRGQQWAEGPAPTAERYGLPGQAPTEMAGVAGTFGRVAQAAVPAAPVAADASTVVPLAAGMRSIRIDLPRTGRPFNFTKILNIDEEPLRITATMSRTRVVQVVNMVIQVTAFLCGLVLAWFQWRREEPRTFWLAIGLALMVVSTASLLLAWRLLHVVLIASVPLTVLAALSAIGWRYLRRSAGSSGRPMPPSLPNAAAWLLIGGLTAPVLIQAAPASTPSGSPTGSAVTVISAGYEGRVSATVATLDLNLAIDSAGTNQILTLFHDDVALQEFRVEEGDARIWRENGGVAVYLPRPGPVRAHLRLLAPVRETEERRQLDFRTPAALATQMSLLIEEAEADVGFPSAVALRSYAEGQGTRVEAVLGGAAAVDLSWTPRMKRSAEAATTVFSQVAAQVAIGNGVVNTRMRFEYQVTQGELRRVRIRLPEGHQVLRVDGEFIRLWDFSSPARDELTITLAKGVAPAWQLNLETELPLGELPTAWSIALPRTMDVTRESGGLLLVTAEDLALSLDASAGVQRVDAAELSAVFGQPSGVFSAHRFVTSEFELRAQADHLEPSVDAVAHHRFTVAPERITLDARIDLNIKRAGLFSLRFALPEGLRIESVAGDAVQRWTETPWEGRRCLELMLASRTLGETSVQLQLVQSLEALLPDLNLRGVTPLGVDKLTDFVLVTAEPGVSLKTVRFEALTEIPPSALEPTGLNGAGSGGLAYKFLATEADDDSTWTLVVAAQPIAAWVRAEIVNVVTVTETLILGRARVRFEIQNAPAGEFMLKVPAGVANVDVQGANVRRRDHTNDVWRVELQSKTRGIQDLTVSWEQARVPGTNDWVFTGVEALEVERDVGYVVFLARAPVQVLPRAFTGDLSRIDVRELPAWAWVREAAGQESDAAMLAYRYLRPGYSVVSGIQQFEEAALLQALVQSVHLVTVVSDDGQRITEMTLSVRNKGRQYLELNLPEGVTVWSAFVGGQPVRPSRRDGSLLLPIERLGGGDEPLGVRLTYVDRSLFPRTRGRVGLSSPTFGVPLQDARWDIFLPADYEYRRFRGSMELQTTDVAPLAQEFTLAEYARQEATTAESARAEVAGNLRRARSLLSAGKVQEAVEDLSLYRALAGADTAAQRELGQLEEELSRGQASNLIQAQRDYTYSNVARFQGPVPAEQASQQARAVDVEEESARRQVQALQKMQAIGVTRVQPLRVNLPTRGLRHSFTQVLQTEVDKPLTVQFTARNTRETGSFKRLVLWIAALGLLWLGAAIVVHFRSPPTRTSRP